MGSTLSILIALEVGSIDRFATAEKLASYTGEVLHVNSSRGKIHYGKVRPDVNCYLKWHSPKIGCHLVEAIYWMLTNNEAHHELREKRLVLYTQR